MVGGVEAGVADRFARLRACGDRRCRCVSPAASISLLIAALGELVDGARSRFFDDDFFRVVVLAMMHSLVSRLRTHERRNGSRLRRQICEIPDMLKGAATVK